jgi:hypothetical protein
MTEQPRTEGPDTTRAFSSWLAGVTLLSLLSQLPSLQSGFISDDAGFSNTAGEVAIAGESFARHAGSYVSHFVEVGRFFPLGLAAIVNFYVTPGLLAYKLSKLVWIALSVVAFAYVVRRMTRSAPMALLSALLAPALLFQYRIYHDPVLSFACLLPLGFLFFSGAAYLGFGFVETGERRFLLSSSLAFTAAIVTYDALLPLALPLTYAVATARGIQRSRRIAATAAYAVPAAAMVGLVLVLRSLPGYRWTEAFGGSFAPAAAFQCLVRQALAALPVSYLSFDPHGIFAETRLALLAGVGAVALITTAGIGLAVWLLLRERTWEETDPAAVFEPWGFALLLAIAPGLAIALSAKYQREIVLGSAYLPVFVACFGVSLGLALALGKLMKRFEQRSRARWTGVFVSVAVAVLSLFNYAGNQRAVLHLNREWKYPREVLEAALAHGLASELPDHAWLAIESSAPKAPWHSRAFFQQRGGKVLAGIVANDPSASCSAIPAAAFEQGLAYYLSYEADGPEGFAVLARLESCKFAAFFGGARAPVRIYRSIPALSAHDQSIHYFERDNLRRALEVSYRRKGDEPDAVRRVTSARTPALRLGAAGDDWQLWALTDAAGLDLPSLRLSLPAVASVR